MHFLRAVGHTVRLCKEWHMTTELLCLSVGLVAVFVLNYIAGRIWFTLLSVCVKTISVGLVFRIECSSIRKTRPVLHVLSGLVLKLAPRKTLQSTLGKRIHTNLLAWWRKTLFRWLAAVNIYREVYKKITTCVDKPNPTHQNGKISPQLNPIQPMDGSNPRPCLMVD